MYVLFKFDTGKINKSKPQTVYQLTKINQLPKDMDNC